MAERALYFWNNAYIFQMVSENVDVILPIVFPALFQSSKSHWNRTIHGLVYNALRMFLEVNPQLFTECTRHYRAIRQQYV